MHVMTLFLLLGSDILKGETKFWLNHCKYIFSQAVLLPGEKEGDVHLMKHSTSRQQILL